MVDFIRRHWVAYLIAAIVALAIGFGAAYVVGEIGSTPENLHAEEVAAEQGSDEAASADSASDSASA